MLVCSFSSPPSYISTSIDPPLRTYLKAQCASTQTHARQLQSPPQKGLDQFKTLHFNLWHLKNNQITTTAIKIIEISQGAARLYRLYLPLVEFLSG